MFFPISFYVPPAHRLLRLYASAKALETANVTLCTCIIRGKSRSEVILPLCETLVTLVGLIQINEGISVV